MKLNSEASYRSRMRGGLKLVLGKLLIGEDIASIPRDILFTGNKCYVKESSDLPSYQEETVKPPLQYKSLFLKQNIFFLEIRKP